MKKIIRLSENDLNRIVKRVINENIYNNDIYNSIMDVIRNSNASQNETIEVLKYILNDMDKSSEMRRGYKKRSNR
jgi:hypothetical protein